MASHIADLSISLLAGFLLLLVPRLAIEAGRSLISRCYRRILELMPLYRASSVEKMRAEVRAFSRENDELRSENDDLWLLLDEGEDRYVKVLSELATLKGLLKERISDADLRGSGDAR